MRLLVFCLLLAFPLQARDCNISFGYGLLISPEQIRIMSNDRTLMQINHDTQLFIKGEWQDLTQEETALVTEYSQGLRKFVPEIVGIAVDGVELGLSAMERMLSGVGSRSQQAEWNELIRETTFQLMSRFVRSGDHFYLAPQSLNELEHFLNGELKPQLNNLARHSFGAVWEALRDTLQHTETNFEQTDPQQWDAMGHLVERINFGLEEKASLLEEKTALFCQRLKELNAIESQLQQRLPQMLAYDVVVEKH
ncbi:DUF2884 family protein [Alkalimonas delamerensis]|uniref:DUF2884 family protein n=1 Tax=Alkalimonas delamerensis TaxID=265981 RepID=A0ABT9GRQ8_9GAMM|nr:DUF2884 family protein [Alkalimonas delamerensis]MDP4529651.1 DUF2884 family protein [Alkalimonas delamerensis]